MRPLVVSHRTNAGSAPENTLAGIVAAIRDGCDAIEVDVRATRDGVPVLMHDRTLRRTTGDPRPLSEVTLAELREVRVIDPHGGLDPQPVPTLDDALAAIAGRCAIEIDFPARRVEPGVVDAVRRHDAEPWAWFTVHPREQAAHFREQCPAARVLLSVDAQSQWVRDLDEAIEVAAALDLHGINAAHTALTAAAVAAAHARGLLVGCWTVNEAAALARALMLGVDAITTDHPGLAFEAIRSRGGAGGAGA